MSSMAKSTRAAMKAKAARMGSSKGPGKVDASDWSPSEPLNTETKTGMRPISRRAFKKGGKVVEKCEGGPAPMRADRAQRKSGGGIGTAIINRDQKSANKEREGGKAHVGGYAEGGKTTKTDPRYEKYNRRIAEILQKQNATKPKGDQSDFERLKRKNPPFGDSRPNEFKRGGDVEQDKKLVKKAIAQHDKHMHGGKKEELKLRKGGKARAAGGAAEPTYEDWKGLQTGKGPADGQGDKTSGPGGTQMPRDAKKTGGAARFGGTRPTGGRIAKSKGGETKEEQAEAEAKLMAAFARQNARARASLKAEPSNFTGLRKDNPNRNAPIVPRTGRKSGGRAKGKTNIVISINAQKPQDPQAMAPKMPTPPPMPVPPVAPPPMGAGAPPMPPGPPPGLAGGAPGGPPGMPPKPFKRGGRAYRSFKDMDAGAMSGMGRIEKTAIAKK